MIIHHIKASLYYYDGFFYKIVFRYIQIKALTREIDKSGDTTWETKIRMTFFFDNDRNVDHDYSNNNDDESWWWSSSSSCNKQKLSEFITKSFDLLSWLGYWYDANIWWSDDDYHRIHDHHRRNGDYRMVPNGKVGIFFYRSTQANWL